VKAKSGGLASVTDPQPSRIGRLPRPRPLIDTQKKPGTHASTRPRRSGGSINEVEPTTTRVRRAVAVAASDRPRPAYLPDELLVTVEHDVVQRWSERPDDFTLAPALAIPFDALQESGLIAEIDPIAGPFVGDRLDARRAIAESVVNSREETLTGVSLVRVAPGVPLEEVRRRLDEIPGVKRIERVPYRFVRPPAKPHGARTGAAGNVPISWNLKAIGWKSRTAPDTDRIKIAVLDSGVDPDHPALDIATYTHEKVSAEDITGHGTHVCGIIAGDFLRTQQFYSGVCNAKLCVWKVFRDKPDPEVGYYVDERAYQRALIAALENGCRVVNLSLGGVDTNSAEKKLVSKLLDAGVTLVAAMGNEYLEGNPVEYPAALPGVIAVGAVDPQYDRASTSNTGEHIDLVAPGVSIPSTLPAAPSVDRPETDYAQWDGTSMAAPHVSAADARLLLANPALTPLDVAADLKAAARKLATMHGRDWTRVYGAGLLQLR